MIHRPKFTQLPSDKAGVQYLFYYTKICFWRMPIDWLKLVIKVISWFVDISYRNRIQFFSHEIIFLKDNKWEPKNIFENLTKKHNT